MQYVVRKLSMISDMFGVGLGRLSHDVGFPPPLSATCAGIFALGTASAVTLWLVSARVARFRVAPSITNDGIDRDDLDLACVVEGLYIYFGFGLGVTLEHSRGYMEMGFTMRFLLASTASRWGGDESLERCGADRAMD